MNNFMAIIGKNKGFFKWMEVVFEFIFRIVSRNRGVRDWFYANP